MTVDPNELSIFEDYDLIIDLFEFVNPLHKTICRHTPTFFIFYYFFFHY